MPAGSWDYKTPLNDSWVVLTMVDDRHWTLTVTGKEGTQLEYTLGSWDFVEKDGACGEIANWRNVVPCGN